MEDFMSNESQDDLQNTISMFEQILEVMPGDQLALRTLYKAHLQLNDRGKAFDRLNRLADSLLVDKDREDVLYLTDQFKLFLDYDKEAVGARLDELRMLEEGASGVVGEVAGQVALEVAGDLDQEMGLAWRLFQEELLSQEEYSNLLTDLTESSSRDVMAPVTVLHALSDRGFKHIARILHYIVESSGAPYMALSGFDVNEEVGAILPLEFMRHRAALPFGKLGDELMLAVLNPFNEDLRRDVEATAGCKCHSYLVESVEYDSMLSKIAALQAG